MPRTTEMTDGPQSSFLHTCGQLAAAIAEALRAKEEKERDRGSWRVRAVSPSDIKAPTAIEDAATVSVQLDGGLSGQVLLSMEQREVGQLLAVPAKDGTDNIEDQWLRLVKASEAALRRALEPQFGPVTLNTAKWAGPPDGAPVAALEFKTDPGAAPVVARIHVDLSLRSALERLAIATHALSQDNMDGSMARDRERIHRVIDVTLAVTLRFGQRQMTLREMLALTTGSLVELDRQIEEPVDLMLGERVIARGEVVIVDGNYGMRVLEVMEDAGSRISR